MHQVLPPHTEPIPGPATTALGQTLALLEDPPATPDTRHGYLDLLGARPSGADTIGQRAMTSRALPLIYERWWRPIGVRLAFGAITIGGSGEARLTDEFLALAPGDRVLDIACGPGNVTRHLLGSLDGDGLVVGLDASPTMLARAVQDTAAQNAGYVRGDAQDLPFRAASFDAVCCYAALYLIADPFAAIDEMVRVLAPGGRLAVLTSCHRGPSALRPLASLATAPSGVRIFGPDEVTTAFADAGLERVRRRIAGFGQFVGARKPA